MSYDRCVHQFTLDFRRPTINRLQIVDGDTANTFEITLKDRGNAVTLDATLHKVVAIFTRADGEVYAQDEDTDVVFTADGVVTIDVYPSSFRTGMNNVKIQLYKRANADDTTYPLLLTTYEQQFQGRSRAVPESGATPSAPQMPMLEKYVLLAKSWAVGGTGKRDGEDADNAEFYAQIARDLFEHQVVEPSVLAWLAANIDQFKVALSADVAAWLTAHITQPTIPVVDTSLSVSGAAADAKVTGELKSEFEYFEDDVHNDLYTAKTGEKDIFISSERNSGYISANGTIGSNATYVYSQRIPVSEGDTITGRGIDSNYGVNIELTMQRICAYTNGTAVAAKGSDSALTSYTVPSGVDEVVVSYLARMTDTVFKHHVLNYVEYSPVISRETAGNLFDVAQKSAVMKINPTVVDGKYVSKSGAVTSNASYYYFEVDDLSEGDIVAVRTFYGASTSIVIPTLRFVCAYNSGGTAVSASGAENVLGQYTVPSGITKVAVSLVTTYPIESVLVFTEKDITDIFVNDNLESAVFASYPQSVSGELAASETITLNANAVKKNKDIIFNGSISAFNKITIGQGNNDLNSSKIVIDTQNVTFYRGSDATGVTNAHGLTFKDYLSVTVSVDNDHIPTVTIMTNGGKYAFTYSQSWVGCWENVYATADASTSLSSCVLTFVCRDIKEPLWIFGDSYVSYTGERWTYWIGKMGYNGYLLNGYSGEDSPHAMRDLRNLLAYGIPKYIVWALGMNDADTSSSASGKWTSVYNELKALCNEKNIQLILCAIPNVPTINNSFKNEIVRNSGYKYIDFASAVGASNDSTWYDNMLSPDGVHPTEQGAYALAAEVLKDFPFICTR